MRGILSIGHQAGETAQKMRRFGDVLRLGDHGRICHAACLLEAHRRRTWPGGPRSDTITPLRTAILWSREAYGSSAGKACIHRRLAGFVGVCGFSRWVARPQDSEAGPLCQIENFDPLAVFELCPIIDN